MSEKFNLDAMLEMSNQDIKAQTLKMKGGGGKRSNWANLDEQAIAVLHKKILINHKIAGDFAAGKIDTAQFFVISDMPTNEKTVAISRNQPVSFQKSGELLNDVVVGFEQTGSNTQLSYSTKQGDVEVAFRVSGMSVTTLKNGSKAIDRCTFPQGDTAEAKPAGKK